MDSVSEFSEAPPPVREEIVEKPIFTGARPKA
jgi:hypothetical protein